LNTAEQALRKCTYGHGLRAVQILDTWTETDRASFRIAYQSEDWKSVYRLCMNGTGALSPPHPMVLIHLMDATAAENHPPPPKSK
jgi:hypothetical protein